MEIKSADPVEFDLNDLLENHELLGKAKEFSLFLFHPEAASPALLNLIEANSYVALNEDGFNLSQPHDVDAYNQIYCHLVLWHDEAQELAGWYRFANTADTFKRYGLSALYSSTLFEYSDVFIDRLQYGFELGRNFIVKKYQKTFALAYLWGGIGRYLNRAPNIKYLFGLMSIPGSTPSMVKAYISYFYSFYFGDDFNRMVKPKHAIIHMPQDLFEVKKIIKGDDYQQDFLRLTEELKKRDFPLRNVIKHSVSLCSPEGTHLLSIGVDPDFNDCMDMFMFDEVLKIKSNKLKKYPSLIQLP